jgi:thiamine-monophosphate kinase
MNEFELIQRYFQNHALHRDDVALGIGDDAALCRIEPGMELVVSTDTLLDGTHFPRQTSPEDIGYKALAVNLSDMAAMGAAPRWFTLALTHPDGDEVWISRFSEGLLSLADNYQVALIGGDTTRGPLSITLQIIGVVPTGQALRRDQAKPGERICVSGCLGDAGLGLRTILGADDKPVLQAQALRQVRQRLNRPTPRVELGLRLRGQSRCAIDISDGLLADLSHILQASDVGASLALAHLPLSPAMRQLPHEQALQLALTAGDDYELCFTLVANAPLPAGASCIGWIEAERGLRCVDAAGKLWQPPKPGFMHF